MVRQTGNWEKLFPKPSVQQFQLHWFTPQLIWLWCHLMTRFTISMPCTSQRLLKMNRKDSAWKTRYGLTQFLHRQVMFWEWLCTRVLRPEWRWIFQKCVRKLEDLIWKSTGWQRFCSLWCVLPRLRSWQRMVTMASGISSSLESFCCCALSSQSLCVLT